jgi:hypothetical protein
MFEFRKNICDLTGFFGDQWFAQEDQSKNFLITWFFIKFFRHFRKILINLMKNYLIFSIPFFLFACENPEMQRKEAYADLERFVDSVETEIDESRHHNWNLIEERYRDVLVETEEAYQGASASAKEDLETLKSRFREEKQEWNQYYADLNQKAVARLDEWERIMEESEDGMERATENMIETADRMSGEAGEKAKKTWEETQAWFRENMADLNEETKERYRKIRGKVEKMYQ